MKFKAVMMDFDGTVTQPGSAVPSPKMIQALIDTARKMPIAFCTGRQLESFERHGFQVLLDEIDDSERDEILKNIFFVGENGSVGYFYNTSDSKYEEFYRAKWPDSLVQKEQLIDQIAAKTSEYGDVINEHRVVFVVHAHHGDNEIEGIKERSRKAYEVSCEILSEIDPDFEKYIHVGDSGIGVIFCPASGDKDSSISKFAEFLKENRGIDCGENAKDIMIIGDSGQPSGNDFYFLQGEYGTPYSVGNYDHSNKLLQLVTDDDGKRLLNEAGTQYLLQHILVF